MPPFIGEGNVCVKTGNWTGMQYGIICQWLLKSKSPLHHHRAYLTPVVRHQISLSYNGEMSRSIHTRANNSTLQLLDDDSKLSIADKTSTIWQAGLKIEDYSLHPNSGVAGQHSKVAGLLLISIRDSLYIKWWVGRGWNLFGGSAINKMIKKGLGCNSMWFSLLCCTSARLESK